MRKLTALLVAAAIAAPLAAQQPGVPSPGMAKALSDTSRPDPTTADVADIRVNQLVIFEGDSCPASTSDTINVCAVLPGSERFRIPENLRGDPNAPENQSWTNKAIALNYVGNTGIGSCSTVGPGGFTGCSQQLINQAVAERRGRPEVNWARLIEEARQERLGQIDQRSAEEELNADGATPRRVQQLSLRAGQECPPSTERVIIVCNYPAGAAPQPPR